MSFMLLTLRHCQVLLQLLLSLFALSGLLLNTDLNNVFGQWSHFHLIPTNTFDKNSFLTSFPSWLKAVQLWVDWLTKDWNWPLGRHALTSFLLLILMEGYWLIWLRLVERWNPQPHLSPKKHKMLLTCENCHWISFHKPARIPWPGSFVLCPWLWAGYNLNQKTKENGNLSSL